MKTVVFFFLCSMTLKIAHGIERKELQNGDLIFQNLDCGPMCDAIEAVTEGFKGMDFSHMGMVYKRNDSLFIIESIGPGVVLSPLEQFLKRTSNAHWVGRLKSRYQFLIPRALGFSLLHLGTAYDNNFLYNNGKYYCSELIYDAFKSANEDKPFFKLYPMTYKAPGTNEFYPVWKDHFLKLNQEVPEDKPGCNPGGMSRSNKIKILGKLEA